MSDYAAPIACTPPYVGFPRPAGPIRSIDQAAACLSELLGRCEALPMETSHCLQSIAQAAHEVHAAAANLNAILKRLSALVGA